MIDPGSSVRRGKSSMMIIESNKHEQGSKGSVNTNISALKGDMCHLLSGYLTREEFLSFLQVSRQVHAEYIDYRYLLLNQKYSLLYHKNEAFRHKVLASIIDPRRQLALNLSGNSEITDVNSH